jgi:hypothetical protein
MSDDPVERYMALVEALLGDEAAGLTPLGAGILAAAHLGIAADSRSFAKTLGIAHALVLREVDGLSEEAGWLTVTRRDPRTQRTFYALTGSAATRLDAASLSLS